MANSAANRYSTLSGATSPPSGRPLQQQQPLTSVSTQTLLNALHSAFAAGKPYQIDSSTSIVVNTWQNTSTVAADGQSQAIIDDELARRSWEHARRRAEDGCVILGNLHESCPSLLAPFVTSLPIAVPASFYTALAAIQPFLTCATPKNGAAGRHSALAVTFSLNFAGTLSGAWLKLSSSGIDTQAGLLQLQAGCRAFDVFYYLLSSASSTSEREFLGLRNPSQYALLRRSATYNPPSYLPTADDAAAAEEWRAALKAIGVTGSERRELVSVLACILKLGDSLAYSVDAEDLEDMCEDAAGLLGLDPSAFAKQCSTQDREVFIGGIYEALVDWVIAKANESIATDIAHERNRRTSLSSHDGAGRLTPVTNDEAENTASITILEITNPELGKAVAMRDVFDDSQGINFEMKEDGLQIPSAANSVATEMNAAVTSHEPELGIMTGRAGREVEAQRDRREGVLSRIATLCEPDSFVRKLLFPLARQGIVLGGFGRFDLNNLVTGTRVWFHLSVHPTDELPATLTTSAQPWSASSPSRQLRAWRMPEWANRRSKQLDFTADFDLDEFCTRYSRLGCQDGREGIESFVMERGWSNGEVIVGNDRVWIRENAWWEAESMLDTLAEQTNARPYQDDANGYSNSGFFGNPFADNASPQGSSVDLLRRQSAGGAQSLAPTAAYQQKVLAGDYGLGTKGDVSHAYAEVTDIDPETGEARAILEQPMTRTRRVWVTFVWLCTFWVPSFVLRYAVRLKRSDVRMAWREKIVLVGLIFLLNAIIVFYIIAFGNLLCPEMDRVWTNPQVGYHQGTDDAYCSVAGKVYDITKFWREEHSNIEAEQTTNIVMQPLLGQNLDPIFPVPLTVACPGLVTQSALALQFNASNYNAEVINSFMHTSGSLSPYPDSPLGNDNWYATQFLPKMKKYYKGERVYDPSIVSSKGQNEQYPWAIINGSIYDLSDYFYTQMRFDGYSGYKFLNKVVENMFQSSPGEDVTTAWFSYMESDPVGAAQNAECLNNAFYKGKKDPRDTARCQVNNYILLAFTLILCAVILIKFLSALQFGSKSRPSQQDKFVICQVPCYTEGEDQLRKGLDSLTGLQYDNKRKLLFVVCDGMIVGGGNDRPTPKIVLDILGVDPKVDPPALPFLSVGEGSERLNYGKVFSGLYEYEGNVVPYIVVVKVGKESEQKQSKPGNRGKRDSQIMLMRFLNRVHHRSPMSPLELEIFHQINNIIGVDPELYEYLFMVDADTTVREDSLNRLVSACAHDAKIAGICGETALENEERSWTTMIQVYEYYISHHLAKAFESLFGSVTCLPGCFCMYRLRTVDKGKPLIISDKVIADYTVNNVDTLHKKNLLSLGEDRYLTTLMTKHFPAMKYKFVPDAHAHTAAPESWSVLLSQRRRWINSTVHNLAELVLLPDLCGFCCFSMRFVVFIDLFGTLILPATCTYLVYLIYRVATHSGQFPLISIVIIAAVYGLQAVIFILRREWALCGWLVIYLMAYPIYSFVLPVYSFWKQDDFSWGNTRVVIGEKGSKQIVAVEDREGFDPRSIPLQPWDDYARQNNLPGARGQGADSALGARSEYGGGVGEKLYFDNPHGGMYEMDDIRSVYSKPASTILTGFNNKSSAMYMQQAQQHSSMSVPPNPNARAMGIGQGVGFNAYTSMGLPYARQSIFSTGTPGAATPALSIAPSQSQIQMSQMQAQMAQMQMQNPFASNDNLLSFSGPATPQHGRSLVHSRAGSLSPSNMLRMSASQQQLSQPQVPNFQQSMSGRAEASDDAIAEAIRACLEVVDLDSVTKKQLKALAEQRLQVELSAERKQFLDRQIDWELANMQ